jgi:hypothetical protein
VAASLVYGAQATDFGCHRTHFIVQPGDFGGVNTRLRNRSSAFNVGHAVPRR